MSKSTGIKGIRVFDNPLTQHEAVFKRRENHMLIIVGRVVFTQPIDREMTEYDALNSALSDAAWLLKKYKREWLDRKHARVVYSRKTEIEGGFDVDEFHRLFEAESESLMWASFWNYRLVELNMLLNKRVA